MLATNLLFSGERLVMAKIIEFYVPKSFRKKELLPSGSQKGRVIEFCATRRKSA